MNSLFDEFRTICSHLNQVGITPTLIVFPRVLFVWLLTVYTNETL